MSKVKLEAILSKLSEKTGDDFRKNVANRFTTSLFISPGLIEQQVEAEVLKVAPTKRGTLPAKLISDLTNLSTECYNNIILEATKSSVVKVDYYKDGALITASELSGDNFARVRAITTSSIGLLKRRINLLLKSSRLPELGTYFFDIGHFEGANTDIRIGYHLADSFNDPAVQKFITNSNLSQFKYALDIASFFNDAGDKSFVVKAVLESKAVNRSRGSKEEKELTDSFNKNLEQFIKTNDWVNQEASDSALQNIENVLVNAAIDAGAKGKKRVRNTQSSSASVKGTLSASPKTQSMKFDPELSDIKVAQNQSSVSLLALLNAKLPPAVRSNMTGGRLHNRTGRFSESVKILSVTETAQGYPRLNYTYQRSPYDVFDPVLGKAPWNTPGRDPKTLIEKSIRDIAKDLVTGRFYVARA